MVRAGDNARDLSRVGLHHAPSTIPPVPQPDEPRLFPPRFFHVLGRSDATSMNNYPATLSVLVFASLLSSAGANESLIILPEEGAIQNAGCGTEIWNGGPQSGEVRLIKTAVPVSEYAVNSMIRRSWHEFETEEGQYQFQKLDRLFESCIRYRQKVNLGVFTTSSNDGLELDGAKCCYPAYIHRAFQDSGHKDVKYTSKLGNVSRWEPNFENPYFFQRYDKLLKAFAEYLNQQQTFDGKTVQRKKLVRYIEMRHFGWWGEGAYPKRLVPSNSDCLIRFADAFLSHFPDIRIIVPTNGMVYLPNVYDSLREYHFHLLTAKNHAGLCGIFRDNWGWDERSSYFQKIYYSANHYERNGLKMYELIRDRWKHAPVVGEPGQTYPRPDFQPYSGLVEQVKYLHPVVIRNCNVSDGRGRSPTNPTDYSIFRDPQALDQFHKMYAILGFRYLYASSRIERTGQELTVRLNWLNIGLTPTYDQWNIRFYVLDGTGKEIWTGRSALDLRTLLPDEATSPGTVGLDKETVRTDRFTDVPAGPLLMRIEDPDGISPPLALSQRGRRDDGSYLLEHP